MALQTIPGGLWIPRVPTQVSAAPSYTVNQIVLDAAGESAGYVFRATRAITLRKVHFRTGTVTTGDTMDVRIETVGADGFPTGTLFGTNTNIAHVIANGDDDAWLTTAALTADANIARNDTFAVVIVNGSTPGNMQIAGYADDSLNYPYLVRKTAAGPAWERLSTNIAPVCALEDSSGAFVATDGVWPFKLINTTAFNSGSNPKERGLYFQVPWPCTVDGFWVWASPATAGADFDVVLYDSDGTTPLSTTSVDRDHAGTLTASIYCLPLVAAVNLAKATNYRLVVKPTSANSISTYDYDVNAAGLLDASAGGQNWHYTQKSSGDVWSQTTTKRAFMGLRFNAFDDATGGAGGGVNRALLASGVGAMG